MVVTNKANVANEDKTLIFMVVISFLNLCFMDVPPLLFYEYDYNLYKSIWFVSVIKCTLYVIKCKIVNVILC